MFLEHAHVTHRVAQQRIQDALRAAEAHRRAREARTFGDDPDPRTRRTPRLHRANQRPCAANGVRGSWQVAFGLRERCA